MKEKILMYGIGSYKNHGCEAIVASTLKGIDSKKYEMSIATYDYDYNRKFYKEYVSKYIRHVRSMEEFSDVEKENYDSLVEKNKFLESEMMLHQPVLDEIEQFDIFLSAGGDNYSYGYSYWLYAIHNKIKKLGKKSILWGASLYDKLTDPELIADLQQYDLLLLRESISYHAALEYIDESKLLLAPDPAFSLKPKKILLSDWYQKRKIVALNISPLTIKTKEQEKIIIQFVDYLLKNTSYSILLLPHVLMENSSDLESLKKIYCKYEKEERVYLEQQEYNCCELKYIISKCHYVVAARTHASIAAYSSCVPTLVLGYSVKSRGIAKDLFGADEHYVIDSKLLTYETLIEEFQYIESHHVEIKKTLKNKMKDYKFKAEHLMDLVEKRLQENKDKTICPTSLCVGCGACMHVCPTGAISMVPNEEGFYYPKIDLSKCISCHRCRKVCPVLNLNSSENTKSSLAFVAKHTNQEVQQSSSSGGAFTALSKWFLDHHGVVYGVTMDHFHVKHLRIDDMEQLSHLRGSKYVQSNAFEVFKNVKEDLKKEKYVLFSGTPCQIAGLKSYLKKDDDRLLCVSVICHGVISEQTFDKYLDEIEINRASKNDQFVFKKPKEGWSISKVFYQTEYQKVTEPFLENSLMNLYIKNYILRDSCYQCSFKGISNQYADIILGDYWGVSTYHPEMFDENGVSCIIALTNKGKKFLNNKSVKSMLTMKKTKLDYIIEGNPMLCFSACRPPKRSMIFKCLENNTIQSIQREISLEEEMKVLKEYVKNLEGKQQKYDIQLEEKNVEATKYYNELQKVYSSRGWRILEKARKIINRK